MQLEYDTWLKDQDAAGVPLDGNEGIKLLVGSKAEPQLEHGICPRGRNQTGEAPNMVFSSSHHLRIGY